MGSIENYIENQITHNFLLRGYEDRISFVLSGSRAVGYNVPSSDYDILGLCEHNTYFQIAELAGTHASVGYIDVLSNKESNELDNAKVDLLLFDIDRVKRSFQDYNDVTIWIWINSKVILDRENGFQKLKESFNGYPGEVLEKKLKLHWLRDFDLSIHGITYHPKTYNIFSVIHALANKMAEMCRLCCLLDGKPFPYSEWLFKACEDTKPGKEIAPIFRRVLEIMTSLNSDLEGHWAMVKEAVRLMDTDVCDILENALVEWGVDENWVHNAHHDLADALFNGLLG